MNARHVAVTGGSTGIGAETVIRLRAAGATVTVFDIAEPSVEVDNYIALDLADNASIDTALASIGAVDGLCNSAGLPPREGNQALVLAVNFIGLRRFTLGMYEKLNKGSPIVNVSSLAGMHWRSNLDRVRPLLALDDDADLAAFVSAIALDWVAVYDLSKEAVSAWTVGQCEALIARGLRMNTVSPGAVQTALLDDFISAFGEERVNSNLDRVGRASLAGEVADAIVFLLSNESQWIKGTDLIIDGGIAACKQSDMMALGDP